jgi:hypothetical protein
MLDTIGLNIIRLVNLIAFDVCDLNCARVISGDNPLHKVLECPILGHIDPTLHPKLRTAIKDYVKADGIYAGKISLVRNLRVDLYLKNLRKPAYVHGESPQDKRS